MLIEAALLTALAIINATIPGQDIPIEVQTRLVGEEFTPMPAAVAEPITSTPALDAGMIGGIVALGTGLFAAYRKNQSRADATADTTVNLAQSLKGTDKGTADTASILARALEQLSGVSPEIATALENCKPAAQENAKEWKQDVHQYYEVQKPLESKDIGLDKVKTKLAEVNKITEKTPEP